MAEIKLYNEDCLEAMRQMPDKAFDLAIVDPPYGISAAERMGKVAGKQHGTMRAPKGNYATKFWDKESPTIEYFENLFRVSKQQIVWGANHFIEKMPFSSSCWIVWDKDNANNSFADCELAWASFDSAVRQFTYTWNGMLQGDMANKEVRIHPTQKPVALYKWLLEKYAKPGDKILDTHLGSGSIAIACHDYQFDLTGYELDSDYYNAALKRLNTHKSQFKLEFKI